MEQLVMDLNCMQQEATDLATDRLMHCTGSGQGDLGSDRLTSTVWLGKDLSGVFKAIPLSRLKS